MTAPQDLTGKIAVVTGAARGIGAMLAQKLAARGATVALLGLEPEVLAETAASCGPDAGHWVVDVTDQARLDEVAADVVARYGRVDIVVANAGIAIGGTLMLADPVSYDRVIEVNLMGSVRTARAFLPALVEAHGYFLQIASMAAFIPLPVMSAYCTSKSGVEAFAHSLRPEVAAKGVDVGVAYLTWTDTDMVRGGSKVLNGGVEQANMGPGPFGKKYPLEPAVDNLIKGIAARKAHIHAQPWTQVVPFFRGALPTVIGRFGGKEAAKAEEQIRAAGPDATLPVGAGGEADRAARAAR
jgi:NAD(P)-dependent dehydrogenase (short-subunit alcohol dehydrogenase family)